MLFVAMLTASSLLAVGSGWKSPLYMYIFGSILSVLCSHYFLTAHLIFHHNNFVQKIVHKAKSLVKSDTPFDAMYINFYVQFLTGGEGGTCTYL